MIASILVLVAWAVSGVALAAFFRPGPEGRFAWAPVALFLGPLWVAVAADRDAHRLAPAPVTVRPQRAGRSAR